MSPYLVLDADLYTGFYGISSAAAMGFRDWYSKVWKNTRGFYSSQYFTELREIAIGLTQLQCHSYTVCRVILDILNISGKIILIEGIEWSACKACLGYWCVPLYSFNPAYNADTWRSSHLSDLVKNKLFGDDEVMYWGGCCYLFQLSSLRFGPTLTKKLLNDSAISASCENILSLWTIRIGKDVWHFIRAVQ